MAIVPVPKPRRSSMNQNRPVSSLLKTQILHLQEAEFRLPAKFQTNIYIHSIRTEGEAGEYIRQVTRAIHDAHATRIARSKPKRKPERAFEMAASASPRKKKAKRVAKKERSKTRPKK